MTRFGLIGCGRHGTRYLRHLMHDVEDASAVALWRRDQSAARALAQEYGVAVARDPQELVERPDVEAVLVTTPPGPHRNDILMAVAAGKPVLVEKPLTGTLDEADELLRALAAEDAPPVMVAQTLRYNPTLLQARRHLDSLGPLHRIRVAQRLEPSDLLWQRDPALAGGGSITLTGVHLFDLLRWFLGRSPDSVSARHLAVEGPPLENLFDACFEYESEGILCATEVSKFSQTRSSILELVGRDAQLIVDYGRGRLQRIRGRDIEELDTPGDRPTLPAVIEDFCRVLRGEIAVPITAFDGRETMRMAEACYRSNREGRRIRLDDIAPARGPRER